MITSQKRDNNPDGQPTLTPVTKSELPSREWDGRTTAILTGVLPLVLIVYISLTSRSAFGGGMYVEPPPTALGLPLGQLLQGATTIWILLGALITWRSRRMLQAVLALLVFTIPGLAAFMLSPAIILILQNLG